MIWQDKMGDEFGVSGTLAILSIWGIYIHVNFGRAVLSILQLIEHAHCDGGIAGPLQIGIIVSLKKADSQRHVAAFSISTSIRNHPETHLVPSKMRVHRITVPLLN